MTCFAWPGTPRGRVRPPQLTVTSFAVPMPALDYWAERLNEHLVAAHPGKARLGRRPSASPTRTE